MLSAQSADTGGTPEELKLPPLLYACLLTPAQISRLAMPSPGSNEVPSSGLSLGSVSEELI